MSEYRQPEQQRASRSAASASSAGWADGPVAAEPESAATLPRRRAEDPVTAPKPPQAGTDAAPIAHQPGVPPASVQPLGHQPVAHGSKLFSNLDLNGPVPPRARPNLSQWGPDGVPTSGAKKRQRWLVPVLFAVALAVIAVMWWQWAVSVGGLGAH